MLRSLQTLSLTLILLTGSTIAYKCDASLPVKPKILPMDLVYRIFVLTNVPNAQAAQMARDACHDLNDESYCKSQEILVYPCDGNKSLDVIAKECFWHKERCVGKPIKEDRMMTINKKVQEVEQKKQEKLQRKQAKRAKQAEQAEPAVEQKK